MLTAKKAFMAVLFVVFVLAMLSAPALAQRVNLSIATVDQIAQVPGMTPALAKAIVDYKAANGLEKAVDLLKVPGMTKEIFSKITPAVDKDGNVLIGISAKKADDDDEEEAVQGRY
jgi:DNA uptake protein ComE-like DNA-binding protein